MKSSLHRFLSSPCSRLRNPPLFWGTASLTFEVRINQPKLFQCFHKEDNHNQDGYHLKSFQVHDDASRHGLPPAREERTQVPGLPCKAILRSHLKKLTATGEEKWRKGKGKRRKTEQEWVTDREVNVFDPTLTESRSSSQIKVSGLIGWSLCSSAHSNPAMAGEK